MTERTPRTELPEALQATVKRGGLGKIYTAANRERAGELEARARQLRDMADESEEKHFQAAVDQLLALQAEGKYSDAELLLARLELHGIDPIRHREEGELDTDEATGRFLQLTPGTPVLGLGGNYTTGIVTGEPTNLTLYKYDTSPRYVSAARFEVPLRQVVSTGEQLDVPCVMDTHLLRFGTIGREAIASAAIDATFVVERSSSLLYIDSTTNTADLKTLRRQINDLYALGMDELDTAGLDTALELAAIANATEQLRRQYGIELRHGTLGR